MAGIRDRIAAVEDHYWEAGFFLLLLLYTLLLLVEARTYTPSGRLFPILIGGLLVVLVAVKITILLLGDRYELGGAGLFDQFAEDLLAQKVGEEATGTDATTRTWHRYRRELEMIGWVFLLLVLLVLLGFQLTIFAFLPAYIYRYERSWRRVIEVTAFTWVGTYLIFIRFLTVPLPGGLIVPDVIVRLLP